MLSDSPPPLSAYFLCPCLLLFSCFLWSSKKWPKQFAVANNIIVRQDKVSGKFDFPFKSHNRVISASLVRHWYEKIWTKKKGVQKMLFQNILRSLKYSRYDTGRRANVLTLSRGGPELTIQGGGQKRLRYIFWPHLLNGSSDLYEIWNLCS